MSSVTKRTWLYVAAGGCVIAAAVFAAGCNHEGNGSHHAMAPQKDIVATAVAADDFNTLVAAVKAAGLVETLQSPGPFTVFAPTDAAFAKLPEGTVENLLKPENRDQLRAVLTYHVVPGRVLAEDVVQLSSATTVQGSDVKIATSHGQVRVDKARVIKTDILCSNGVIHAIDGVLLP